MRHARTSVTLQHKTLLRGTGKQRGHTWKLDNYSLFDCQAVLSVTLHVDFIHGIYIGIGYYVFTSIIYGSGRLIVGLFVLTPLPDLRQCQNSVVEVQPKSTGSLRGGAPHELAGGWGGMC